MGATVAEKLLKSLLRFANTLELFTVFGKY